MRIKRDQETNRELLQTKSYARFAKFAFESQRGLSRLKAPPKALTQYLSDYSEWSNSLMSGEGPLALGVPWMPYSAIRHLGEVVPIGGTLFEWGSGGSSLFFARRGLEGVSIEHDGDWAVDVEQALADNGFREQWEVRHVPPKEVPEAHSEFVSHRIDGWSFEDYVGAIDEFPSRYFDVVVVDGRVRNACIKRAIRHVKPGGLIVLDNSERPRYADAIDYLQRRGWRRQVLTGPVPATAHFSATSFFTKPSNDS
jgi:hypothetical protein